MNNIILPNKGSMISSKLDQVNLESQLKSIISILQQHDRTQQQIKTLEDLTIDVPFFKEYRKEGKEFIHRRCCALMGYESFKKGDTIFNIDTSGDKFYIILQGIIGVYIRMNKHVDENGSPDFKKELDITEMICVKELSEGMSFGELSLIQNKKRLASIVCHSDCLIATLDKHSFHQVLGESEEQKILKEMQFFAELPFFEGWNFNLLKLLYLNSFQKIFTKGQFVFKENSDSNAVYFIKSGEFEVSKTFSYDNIYHYGTEKEEFSNRQISSSHSSLQKMNKKKNIDVLLKSPSECTERVDSKYLNSKMYDPHLNNTYSNDSFAPEGKLIKLCIYSPKELFGEEDILENKRRSFGVRCISLQGELIMVKIKDFQTRFMTEARTQELILKRYKLKKKMMEQKISNISKSLQSYSKFFFSQFEHQIQSSIPSEQSLPFRKGLKNQRIISNLNTFSSSSSKQQPSQPIEQAMDNISSQLKQQTISVNYQQSDQASLMYQSLAKDRSNDYTKKMNIIMFGDYSPQNKTHLEITQDNLRHNSFSKTSEKEEGFSLFKKNSQENLQQTKSNKSISPTSFKNSSTLTLTIDKTYPKTSPNKISLIQSNELVISNGLLDPHNSKADQTNKITTNTSNQQDTIFFPHQFKIQTDNNNNNDEGEQITYQNDSEVPSIKLTRASIKENEEEQQKETNNINGICNISSDCKQINQAQLNDKYILQQKFNCQKEDVSFQISCDKIESEENMKSKVLQKKNEGNLDTKILPIGSKNRKADLFQRNRTSPQKERLVEIPSNEVSQNISRNGIKDKKIMIFNQNKNDSLGQNDSMIQSSSGKQHEQSLNQIEKLEDDIFQSINPCAFTLKSRRIFRINSKFNSNPECIENHNLTKTEHTKTKVSPKRFVKYPQDTCFRSDQCLLNKFALNNPFNSTFSQTTDNFQYLHDFNRRNYRNKSSIQHIYERHCTSNNDQSTLKINLISPINISKFDNNNNNNNNSTKNNVKSILNSLNYDSTSLIEPLKYPQSQTQISRTNITIRSRNNTRKSCLNLTSLNNFQTNLQISSANTCKEEVLKHTFPSASLRKGHISRFFRSSKSPPILKTPISQRPSSNQNCFKTFFKDIKDTDVYKIFKKPSERKVMSNFEKSILNKSNFPQK